jgi:hypothetical protein
MGSNYLTGITNSNYGLPDSLPGGVAQQASAIVDAYLQRPEGLLYTADANGNPCFMSAATPELTYTITSAITAGTNVVATVTPAMIRPDFIGEVLVLDRQANPSLVEACTVVATTGNNQVTLDRVQFNHGASCIAETGLVISEERAMPNKRSITRVARKPIANVISLYDVTPTGAAPIRSVGSTRK